MRLLPMITLLLLPVWAQCQPDKVYRSLDEVGDPDEVYVLRLRGKRLRTLPTAIYGMRNLRELDLRGNRIKSLPDSIALLQNLERIVLSRNPIASLPPALALLPNLRELVLWDTRVSELPKEYARLDGILNLLDLRDCPLTLDDQEAITKLLPSVVKLWDNACNCGD